MWVALGQTVKAYGSCRKTNGGAALKGSLAIKTGPKTILAFTRISSNKMSVEYTSNLAVRTQVYANLVCDEGAKIAAGEIEHQ
jgi:hypothetical protein